MVRKGILAVLIIFSFVFSSCNKKSSSIEQNPETLKAGPQIEEKENSSKQAPKDSSLEQHKNASTDSANLNNKPINWGVKPNSNHTTPEIPADVKQMLEKYSGYYVGDTSSKVLYLTFDQGYENGYTSKILDVLKANNVKAAFFVVKPYITQNPDLIKRMVQEGHMVVNHSSKHPSMPEKTGNIEAFKKEFTEVEESFKEVTGLDMPKYFRPPMGVFSERSLYLTQQLGYKTVLWSLAHKDWEVNNQPSAQAAHDIILKRVHNGSIILLHSVSKANTEALDSIIKDLKAQGYRFATLDELK
jgi:peptidoglycan-N-acetylmuramic acid deacetylase